MLMAPICLWIKAQLLNTGLEILGSGTQPLTLATFYAVLPLEVFPPVVRDLL